MVEPHTNIPNPEALEFMHLKIKVGDKLTAMNLDQDLSIPEDPEDLAREIAKYPALYFFYSSVGEVAKKEELELRRRYETWEAEAYLKVKRDLMEAVGKATEASIQATFHTTYADEINEWNQQLDRAVYRKNILSLAAKSMLEKGTAAVNILSYKKQQMADAGR